MAVHEKTETGVRPFWSGTISFGLVSVPVYLFAAHRGSMSLRMLDKDGTPLRRRYYCPEHKRDIHREHILRGYEVADDQYVVVRDEELEAIAPRKSRDIDLRRFVDQSKIPPMYIERSFFLAPSSESNKAYRLLAEVMEHTNRAGIATFVMRDKEYLVSIVAENGILRAQTLRFMDEVLDPEKVGLPDKPRIDTKQVNAFERLIKNMTKDELATDDLQDTYVQRLSDLIDEKWKSGEDVVEADVSDDEDEDEESEEGNLIEAIRRSLHATANGTSHDGNGRHRARKGSSRRGPPDHDDLTNAPKDELYDRAKQLDIPGRSHMNKNELIKAIRSHQR